MSGDVDGGRGASLSGSSSVAGPSDGTSRRSVALFQPVLAHYRVDLFNAWDDALDGGLTVFTVSAPGDSRLGGADELLTAGLRSARTFRIGPVWFVPGALVQVLAGRWDVVVLSWNSRQVELLPALLLARVRRIPVVLWGHGMGRKGSRAGTWLRRVQARLASTVLTYSDAGADEVRREVPGCRVEVLLNTTGRPPPEPGDELERPRGRVAHLGRLLSHKKVDHLIEAVARLDQEGTSLEVDLVGDGPARPEVEAVVARNDLEDRVHLHGQVTAWDDVRAVLEDVDVVVLPARAGLSVVDGFAVARPVLVVDDPALNPPEADLVVDGVNGFRYGPCTVEALTDRLRRIYDRPEAIVRAAAGAGDTYRRRLRLEHATATFVEVISTVSGTGAGR